MLEQKVKERGIIFSTELIPKVLDGTKTMTRRTYGLEEINKHPDVWCKPINIAANIWQFENIYDAGFLFYVKCPYGQVGDGLYVKETWAIAEPPLGQECGDIITTSLVGLDTEYLKLCEFLYKARDTDNETGWRSPLFMYRWASRIDLEITDLGAERLWGIGQVGIFKEGIRMLPLEMDRDKRIQGNRKLFADLWDSINPKYPWEANHWVWPIEFRRI